MFKSGELYLERVITGKLTFANDGTPEVTPLKHDKVLNFANQSLAEELMRKYQFLPVTELKPSTEYVRLFQAPVPGFNERGELQPPVFTTLGFFLPQNVGNVCPLGQGTFELLPLLQETVLQFFDKKTEEICPLAK